MSFILNGISTCNVVRTGKKLGCCGRRFEQIFIEVKLSFNIVKKSNSQMKIDKNLEGAEVRPAACKRGKACVDLLRRRNFIILAPVWRLASNLVPRGRDPFGQRRGSIFPAHDKRDP